MKMGVWFRLASRTIPLTCSVRARPDDDRRHAARGWARSRGCGRCGPPACRSRTLPADRGQLKGEILQNPPPDLTHIPACAAGLSSSRAWTPRSLWRRKRSGRVHRAPPGQLHRAEQRAPPAPMASRPPNIPTCPGPRARLRQRPRLPAPRPPAAPRGEGTRPGVVGAHQARQLDRRPRPVDAPLVLAQPIAPGRLVVILLPRLDVAAQPALDGVQKDSGAPAPPGAPSVARRSPLRGSPIAPGPVCRRHPSHPSQRGW